MLSPWVGWFARLVRSCKLARPRWQFGLVSNPSICERMTSETPAVEMSTFSASQSDLLRAFEFDRGAYARDLFRYESDSPSNAALIRRLTEVKQAFHPDLVLSFSQNRYVRPVLQTPALFIELGPLPRSVTRPHFFLDPLGHQTESLLVTEIRTITSRPLAAQRQREVQRFWFETCEQPITAASSTADLQAFLHESRRGRKVVLLALQPPDWLTYEGAWRSLSVSGLMMHWLDNLPANAVGCVSYHPLHQISAGFRATLRTRARQRAVSSPSLAPGSLRISAAAGRCYGHDKLKPGSSIGALGQAAARRWQQSAQRSVWRSLVGNASRTTGKHHAMGASRILHPSLLSSG